MEDRDYGTEIRAIQLPRRVINDLKPEIICFVEASGINFNPTDSTYPISLAEGQSCAGLGWIDGASLMTAEWCAFLPNRPSLIMINPVALLCPT